MASPKTSPILGKVRMSLFA